MKWGAALYAGWVALVITGIIGGLGLAFQQPWLFPASARLSSFIPSPRTRSRPTLEHLCRARHWRDGSLLSLALFGALHAPSAMAAGHVRMSRIAASALAVALTIGGQIPARAGHAPATATTLLITLGGLPADLATVGVMIDRNRPVHPAMRLGTASGRVGVRRARQLDTRLCPAFTDEAAGPLRRRWRRNRWPGEFHF